MIDSLPGGDKAVTLNYRQISNINRSISQHLNVFSCIAVVFAQSIEDRHKVEHEDVVGEAPTGYASTTSGWSTILLPKVRLVLQVWR